MRQAAHLGVSFVLLGSFLCAIPPARAASLGDLSGSWQLLVDDYLLDAKSNLSRTYHQFTKSSADPLLIGDEAWEGNFAYMYGTVLPTEDSSGYRMWYHVYSDDSYKNLYATSTDGVNWTKPDLAIYSYGGSTNNNILTLDGMDCHLPQVIHTPWESDPNSQYKLVGYNYDKVGFVGATSPDGIHWSNVNDNFLFYNQGDVGNFTWDARENRYLATPKIAAYVLGYTRRSVGVSFSENFDVWTTPSLVITPDEIDDYWVQAGGQRTEFYGLSAFAYESGYLGFLWMFHITDGGDDGPIYPELVSSRDGIHWTRQEAGSEGYRTPLLPLGASGAWDDGMIFTPNHPLVEGDTIKLYYGGINDTHGYPSGSSAAAAIGLATMRKDGFVSLDADDFTTGTATTKSLTNMSGPLLLNADASGGWLKVEVLDAQGQVIPGYSAADCAPITADGIDLQVSWNGQSILPQSEEPMQLRFLMQGASLYSFMAGDNLDVYKPFVPITGAVNHKGVLFTFEGDVTGTITDKMIRDDSQDPTVYGDITVVADASQAARGERFSSFPNSPSTATLLDIPNTSNLGTAFTLAAVVEESGSGYSRLFSAYDGGAAAYNELVFDFDDSGETPAVPGLRAVINGTHITRDAQFNDGQYHHLALTYNDGLVRLYLDGQQLGDAATAGSGAVELLYNLHFGEDHGSTSMINEPFEGRADDILVFRRPLSGSQMAALAAAGAESFFSGPLGAKLTAEGDSSFAADSRANDGLQNGVFHGNVAVDNDPSHARNGNASFAFVASQSGGSTIELAETDYLGDEFTLAAFVNAASNKCMRLFSSYDGAGDVSSNELLFEFDPDGSEDNGLRFIIGGETLTPDAPLGFNLNEYHHLAVTFDAGNVSLYLDGLAVAATQFNAASVSLAANLLVGEDWGGTSDEQLLGNVDDIFVCYQALSPQEILALADASYKPGDANRDHKVNAADAALLASNWLKTNMGWGGGDFNEDGIVNDLDAALMAANWHYGMSSSASVPEPASFWLLLGGFVMLALYGTRRLAPLND